MTAATDLAISSCPLVVGWMPSQKKKRFGLLQMETRVALSSPPMEKGGSDTMQFDRLVMLYAEGSDEILLRKVLLSYRMNLPSGWAELRFRTASAIPEFTLAVASVSRAVCATEAFLAPGVTCCIDECTGGAFCV